MGPCRLILFAVPLLLAMPALAQQSDPPAVLFTLPRNAPPPPDDPRRQGPELDVFRAPATTPPPAAAPTNPPPRSAAPIPTPPPFRHEDARPARTPAPVARAAVPEAPQPAPVPQAIPAPAQPIRAAVPSPARQPAPRPVPVAPTRAPWPWIISGALAVAALVAAWLLSRRRRAILAEAEPEAEPIAIAPAPPLPTPPLPTPPAAGRPWIDLSMDISLARYSLIGITLGYTLLLHNRGDTPARDIMVRSHLCGANSDHLQRLQQFFSGETGLPVHWVTAIAPGETARLYAELRVDAEAMAPVRLGDRALLVPLVAFDTEYHWTQDGVQEQGSGRTARAFIIGQEQEPPADRLAPFRLDAGPRQYPRPAARAAAELPPS